MSLPRFYPIFDSADWVSRALAVGVRMIQLRMKDASDEALRAEIARARDLARQAGAILVVNDHWQTALAAGARALHLGQEDLLALTPQDHARLAAARAQGVQLGISSHSLWELCRAAGLQPDLIACGPVWATTTKDMPWLPQGLDNLAWWAYMAPAPVVGIGGILEPAQLQAVAAAGAAGGCVVRGLGGEPAATLPAWRAAWVRGQGACGAARPPVGPHPTLTGAASLQANTP